MSKIGEHCCLSFTYCSHPFQFLLKCKQCLYIVDINPLPVVDIINTVSPSRIHLSQLCSCVLPEMEVLN